MTRQRKIALLFFVVLFVASCAARHMGVYHRVKKDETLWRIARTYNTDIDAIVEANNLPGREVVEEGSLLFIPGATETVTVTPPPATKKKAVARTVQKKAVTKTVQKKPVPAKKKTTTVAKKGKSYRPVFIWPLKGKVSSKFGIHSDGMRRNNGIKIEGKDGARIMASAAGTVILSAPLKYYGETVIIKHSSNYRTVYSNLKKRLVTEGHVVKKGQQIALLGREEKSGRERLYFEIRYKNSAKNPLKYLR
ncbi:MAG: LysM peptidoglycan-binding domain-containing M23 family metallopeptidase [Thermodesulfobacteriota bacterium]|nr:LysM peptidoglycan-binding domain-containing M23 family metallopeptidase [Thermodesulfobacteriota bacterium]